MKLQAGRYFAGVDIPLIVPNSLVVSKLEAAGAKNVKIFDRDEAPKLSFDPKVVDKSYSDDWDELIVFDYPGPDKEVDIEKMWAWLVYLPPSSPAAKNPLPAPTSSVSTIHPMGNECLARVLLLSGIGLILFGLANRR